MWLQNIWSSTNVDSKYRPNTENIDSDIYKIEQNPYEQPFQSLNKIFQNNIENPDSQNALKISLKNCEVKNENNNECVNNINILTNESDELPETGTVNNPNEELLRTGTPPPLQIFIPAAEDNDMPELEVFVPRKSTENVSFLRN